VQDYLNTTRRSIAWFKQAHDNDQLVMRPPFQRNVVWTESQQSFLIDTILRGYPIPELYMQEEVSEDGLEKHVVVDGQQRIKACLLFLEGKFCIDGETSPEWKDMKFEELGTLEKKRVFSYNFIVRQIPVVGEAEIREVFGRLNRNNVALNNQELRHATYWGPFIKSMERVADLEYWTTSGIFTANDVRRMLDIEFISELAIAALYGAQNKKEHLDKYFAVYERDFPDQARIESVFATVLGEIGALLPGLAKTRWRKKSDFYTLFLVLAAHSQKLPFASDKREAAASLLLEFGTKVDRYISKPGKYPIVVSRYARAIEKAASDIGNRKARFDSLELTLEPVLKKS
jgi:hypothetical protein